MTKTPKRRIKQNVYGNWVGYVGTQRVEEFGDASYSEGVASLWVESQASYQEAFDQYYGSMKQFTRRFNSSKN